MIEVSVQHNIDQVARDIGALSDRIVKRAAARALNRIGAQAKTQAVREIKERYRIGTRMMSKYITVSRRASAASLFVVVKAEGRPLPLLAFNARQTRQGVSVEIVKGNRKLLKHAFIGRLKSGHEGVFSRVSGRGASGYLWGKFQWRHGKGSRLRKKGRDLPIAELLTLGIPQAFSNRVVMERLEALVRDKFPAVFDHEVKFLLGGGR